ESRGVAAAAAAGAIGGRAGEEEAEVDGVMSVGTGRSRLLMSRPDARPAVFTRDQLDAHHQHHQQQQSSSDILASSSSSSFFPASPLEKRREGAPAPDLNPGFHRMSVVDPVDLSEEKGEDGSVAGGTDDDHDDDTRHTKVTDDSYDSNDTDDSNWSTI
ncbi:hypothetical protein FRC17_005612, partial [Serendipita sp. 399]